MGIQNRRQDSFTLSLPKSTNPTKKKPIKQFSSFMKNIISSIHRHKRGLKLNFGLRLYLPMRIHLYVCINVCLSTN